MPLNISSQALIISLLLTVSCSAITSKKTIDNLANFSSVLAANAQTPTSSNSWQNARLVRTIPLDGDSVSISPDGRILANYRRAEKTRTEGGRSITSLTNENVITLTNINTADKTHTLRYDSSAELKSLLFSPNSQLIASYSYNAAQQTLAIRLWDVSTGQEMQTLRRLVKPREVRENGVDYPSNSVIGFTPDGKSLISISGGNPSIYVWDINSQKRTATQKISKTLVSSTANKNNQKLQSKNNSIEQAVQQDRRRYPAYETQDYKIVSNALDAGKDFAGIKALLRQQSKMVQHWRKTEPKNYEAKTTFYVDFITRLQTINYVHHQANAVLEEFGKETNGGGRSFAAEGLVIERNEPNFVIADNNGQRVIMQIKNDSYDININPSFQDVIKVKSLVAKFLNQGNLRFTLTGHLEEITTFAFSSDSQLVATGSRDKTIKVWNLKTGKLIHTLKGNSNSSSLIISPNNQWLVSAETDYEKIENGKVKFWDLKTGKLIRTVPNPGIVKFYRFSKDGKKIITLSTSPFTSTQLQIWDVNAGKLIHQGQNFGDPKNSTTSIAISSDEKMYAIAGQERTFQIRDLMTDKPIKNFGTEESEVFYSNDGNSLVTIGREGIKIWQ